MLPERIVPIFWYVEGEGWYMLFVIQKERTEVFEMVSLEVVDYCCHIGCMI